MLIVLACAPPPDDTADTSGTGWSTTELDHPDLLQADGDWVLRDDGSLLQVGGTWTEVESPGEEDVRSFSVGDGVVWESGYEWLAELGSGWTVHTGPDGVFGEILARDDGTVVLIDSHMDCDDCKGAVVENELYTWDGAWTTLTPALTEDWLTHLAELDDGTLVAAGTDVAEWYGDWTFEGVNGSFADVTAQGGAILAVTDAGTVFQGLPGDLVEETVGTEPLVAVADAGGVAWALGTSNAWYDAGAGWTAVALPEGTWQIGRAHV